MLPLRASSIKAFRSCPQKYRLGFVHGLTPETEQSHFRYGTNWHECHRVYGAAKNLPNPPPDPDAQAMAFVQEFINRRYETIPHATDPIDWETERTILLTCFTAYQWFWQETPAVVTESEIHFNLDLDGIPISGTIDAIADWQGKKVIVERKTTSMDLSPDSHYWPIWKRDIQVSMYNLAGRAGLDVVPGSVLLDVFRKPTIRVKKKESVEEYGQRLLEDIQEQPERYFARKELARTEQDVERTVRELKAAGNVISFADLSDQWYSNEAACNPIGSSRCQFYSLCHGQDGADRVVENLTIKGLLPTNFVVYSTLPKEPSNG